MPKKSTREPKTAEEVFESDSETEQQANDNDVSAKREELIKQAEFGEIKKSVSYLKKAKPKSINRVYSEYERQRDNEILTNLIISRFASALGSLDAIESSEELLEELDKDQLLKRDVFNFVEKVSPYIYL